MSTARRTVETEDIPNDVRDQFARYLHRWECRVFDGGTANRWFEVYRYTGEHRENDMHRAAVHLADVLNTLCVDVDEFLLIVDRRLWKRHNAAVGATTRDETGPNAGVASD